MEKPDFPVLEFSCINSASTGGQFANSSLPSEEAKVNTKLLQPD
jgi:hypothetical protein